MMNNNNVDISEDCPKLHRVTLQSVDGSEEGSFTFDLLLKADGKPLSNVNYFGCHGSITGSGGVYPFILKSDGTIDYGGGYELDGRYGKTNLLSKNIMKGEYATVCYHYDNELIEMTGIVTNSFDLVNKIK